MAVQGPGEPLRAIEQHLSTPAPGYVRIAVVASGVCHADIATAAARGKNTVFPVIPGHEIAGVVSAIGDDAGRWNVGDRVAVGWYGGSCGQCSFCRSGDVVHCPERKTPGVSYPGGWARSVTVPVEALASIPQGMDFFDAAPMGCAGVTTFNAIRNAHLIPGSTVAVFGIGGLGHLAVQFSAAMGYRTVAISRGNYRAVLAQQLGANHYIDSTHKSPGEELRGLGGADLIVCTAPSTKTISDLLPGLAIGGRVTLIGVDSGDINVPVADFVMKNYTITGQLTGSARDIEETMRFAQINGVRPMIERMPLRNANEAIERVASGDARFRIVLETESEC